MCRRLLILLGFFILTIFPQLVMAQITSPGVPYSKGKALPSISVMIDIPSASLADGRVKVALEEGLKPFLFAIPVDTSISVTEMGKWDELIDGGKVCRIAVKSEGAYSLNITFSEYRLPSGVSVFIYTPDYKNIRGAYTDFNNKKSKKLATTPMPGDELIVELNIPPGFQGFFPELTIGRIAHDFKNPFGFKSGYGKSGDCNVDINCVDGDEWQTEKNSVAKFIRGGTWLCSGALINNTANDGRPLFLTANHCIGSDRHAETSIFYFNYESPTCGGPNGRLDHSISGCILLSTTTKLDFALVEFSVPPPPEFEPYYAGWNRTVGAVNENVTCIHHPSGDVKKISKRYGRVATGNFGSGFDSNTHWLIPSWDVGTTEGGSSGSPLFDMDHRIIGDLTGGDASCTYNFNDYFQKFFVCWDKYPEPDDQLKHWLDPLGEDPLIWNGFDPNAAGLPVANFKFSPNPPEVGKETRFKDISEGQPTQWTWSFENGNPATSYSQNPKIKFKQNGYAKVKLIVENAFGKDSVQQTIYVTEFTVFEADQTSIVAGETVNYSDLSSGNPLSYNWSFEGGEPGTWSGPEPIDISYGTPGIYDVNLIVEYPEFIDTLYYRDLIKVEYETLQFSGNGINSLSPLESIQVYELPSKGFIPGSNTLGIDAFANSFTPNPDTLRVATGVRIPIGKLPGSVTGSYLTAVLWDDEFNELARDSVELINEPFPDYQTVWFKRPVGIDTLVHAGFIVPENETGVFCSKIATPRGQGEPGSAFARKNGEWTSMAEAAGLITDLGITLETRYVFNDYISQIKLTPKITNDRIYLDLSNLVFDEFNVELFDMLGKKIISDYSLSDKYLELQFIAPVSGLYLMRFQLDDLSFTKKIMLVKNR